MSLQHRVAELIVQHGSLRAAARAIQVEPAYLCRLGNGERARPGKDILRRMGLRAVLTYERIEKD
jgi:hypothetical protein